MTEIHRTLCVKIYFKNIFEVFTAMKIQVMVFWIVTPGSGVVHDIPGPQACSQSLNKVQIAPNLVLYYRELKQQQPNERGSE
jgi:hypothetical protein